MQTTKKATKIEKISDRRDRAATEAALVEAAALVFSKKGFENASTREIASTAGCSEALIQRYFSGKEGLLLSVLKTGSATFQEQQQAKIANLPTCESIEKEIFQLFEAVMETLFLRAPVIRILLSRALIDPEFREDFKKISVSKSRIDAFKKRLQPYKDEGKMHASVDVGSAAQMLISAFFQLGFLQRQLADMSELEVKKEGRKFCAVFARGISP